MPPEDKELAGSKTEALAALAGTVHEAYKDLVQPAAREAGTFLQTVGMLLNAAMKPIRRRLENSQQFGEEVVQLVSEKLDGVNPAELYEPPPGITVKIVNAMLETDDDVIISLFAELIASSMRVDRRQLVHPAMVEIVRQMAPDDALLFREIAEAPKDEQPYIYGVVPFFGQHTPDNVPNGLLLPRCGDRAVPYLSKDNLRRCGVINEHTAVDEVAIGSARKWIPDPKAGSYLRSMLTYFELTPWGYDLCQALNISWAAERLAWPLNELSLS